MLNNWLVHLQPLTQRARTRHPTMDRRGLRLPSPIPRPNPRRAKADWRGRSRRAADTFRALPRQKRHARRRADSALEVPEPQTAGSPALAIARAVERLARGPERVRWPYEPLRRAGPQPYPPRNPSLSCPEATTSADGGSAAESDAGETKARTRRPSSGAPPTQRRVAASRRPRLAHRRAW